MKKVNSAKLLSAILTILLGVLFLIWKGTIVRAVITGIGILLIVAAVMSLIRKDHTSCVICAVFGALIIAFGQLFLSAAFYVLAAVLLIYGILLLIEIAKRGLMRVGVRGAIIRIAQPLLCILAACCLLLYQGDTVDWLFILSGLFLMVEGVLALGDAGGLK